MLSIGVRIVEALYDDIRVVDTVLSCIGIISQKHLLHKAKNLMAVFVKEL
jgi:hypothetical protein